MEHLLKHDESLDFIFAGKSIFTVKNTKTGNRFTFKVNKHKNQDIFFVRLLTSPDIFQYIGSIDRKENYKHSFKSKIGKKAQSVKTFNYLVNKLRSSNLPEFIEIWHMGKCGRCGRRLTVPESLETGYGAGCLKKIKNNRNA